MGRPLPGGGNVAYALACAPGLDVVAPLYAAQTEAGVQVDEIRDREGLGAALRWRAAQFAAEA